MICTEGCGRDAIALGLCRLHYTRRRRGRDDMAAIEAKIGTPADFGVYGVFEREEASALCHLCGSWHTSVGNHAFAVHGVTASEYRAMYGLKRTQPLTSLGASRAMSERSAARVGSPAWQRLEAVRDPASASAARQPSDFRAPATLMVQAEKCRDLGRKSLGAGQVRTCPACGSGYRGRRRTCGKAECVQARQEVGGRNQPRGRALTDAEVARLRAARDVATVVRGLQDTGVQSASIAAALGVTRSWVSKHFPVRGRG